MTPPETTGYESPPATTKSLVATVYEEAEVRSTAGPVHVPSTAWRTTETRREPAAASMLYETQRPDTCGKRPSRAGIRETPFSSIALSFAPSTVATTLMLPNGSTVFTWPRVMGYGGGVNAGQKSDGLSTMGQVRSARMPPEFMSAKSVPCVSRRASVITSPISDSHVRPLEAPQESARGMRLDDVPTWVLKMGASALRYGVSIAMMPASGVTAATVGVTWVCTRLSTLPVPRWIVRTVLVKVTPLERFSTTNWPLRVPDHATSVWSP